MAQTPLVDIDRVVDGARDAMNVRRVYGDPIDDGSVRIIPAARLRGGAGAGSGTGPEDKQTGSGGGAGFGLVAQPAGAFVVENGQVKWRPAINTERLALAATAFGIVALLVGRSIVRTVMRAEGKHPG